jgi:hypothetical protein
METVSAQSFPAAKTGSNLEAKAMKVFLSIALQIFDLQSSFGPRSEPPVY